MKNKEEPQLLFTDQIEYEDVLNILVDELQMYIGSNFWIGWTWKEVVYEDHQYRIYLHHGKQCHGDEFTDWLLRRLEEVLMYELPSQWSISKLSNEIIIHRHEGELTYAEINRWKDNGFGTKQHLIAMLDTILDRIPEIKDIHHPE